MSNFLINHFARTIVKAARSQSKADKAQPNSQQGQWIIALKALGLSILFLSIIVGAIGIILIALLGNGNIA